MHRTGAHGAGHGTGQHELVRRAAEIVPVLRAHAAWGDENRVLHEASLEAMADAGVLRLRVPAEHGGHEADLATVVGVIAELARGDGSAAWTAAVWALSTWVVGQFPDDVRCEVFAKPDVRVTGILSPTATAEPVGGGVLVNGRWAFTTGASQSHWTTNAAVLLPDRTPVALAIPLVDLSVVDDWHTTGLRATGSVTTVAKDVFVPSERLLRLEPVLRAHPHAAAPMFRAPFTPAACATVSAPAAGLARAAVDAARGSASGLREATVLADEAEFHSRRAAAVVDLKAADGEEWTPEDRAGVRRDLGEACLRARDAVDVLAGGSPALHRVQRDAHALNLHAILHPNANLERYGPVFLGSRPEG
ncbi:acyl-CoA dehydrogenase family protein [Saccharothrix luteola]|uniref:acyl-CoA dehydrogenase family protein n=1 Tax=Saccharothrix luteola TaxID=2893018 RepID=UPI001E2F7AD4|nr:acyl-CoA dehydrogenase family protein [Saccharothrix luteola]MCC8246073.1 acyl-CoA dehydrogenase family protein [Saccharothrix luteola]